MTDRDEGSPANLDFYLPGHDLHIEVKQLHSPRIAQQMARAHNVIAVQGRASAEFIAECLISRRGR